MPLSPFYGNVDVVGAYDKARAQNAGIDDMNLKRQLTLAQLLQQKKEQDRAQQFQQEIAGATTPEQQMAIAAKYAKPADIMHYGSAAADRKTALGLKEAESAQRAKDAQLARDQRMDELRLRLSQQGMEAKDRAALLRELTMLKVGATTEKPPAGYRKSADGNLEPIPGGPADLKVQGQFNQDTSAFNSTSSDLDRLAQEANRLLNSAGLDKATGKMAIVPGIGGFATIPGTDAANFKAGLETLKSQVAFGVLQNMRNNSKTGGALGQVSDKEGQLLQANLAALDRAQSPEAFRAALGRIVTYTEQAKDRLRSAYNLKHGARTGAEAPVAQPAPATTAPKRVKFSDLPE